MHDNTIDNEDEAAIQMIWGSGVKSVLYIAIYYSLYFIYLFTAFEIGLYRIALLKV